MFDDIMTVPALNAARHAKIMPIAADLNAGRLNRAMADDMLAVIDDEYKKAIREIAVLVKLTNVSEALERIQVRLDEAKQ